MSLASRGSRSARTSSPVARDSLAFALFQAARACTLVASGTALPAALKDVFDDIEPNASQRGAIQALAYQNLRQQGRSRALLDLLSDRAVKPELLRQVLMLALSLLSPDDSSEADNRGYPAFTVVDQAVAATALHPKLQPARAMVNAVLRRFMRETDTLIATVDQQASAHWNYPEWWIGAVQRHYPLDWQKMLTVGNQRPPLTLRVNLRKTTADNYLERLRAQGLNARKMSDTAIKLDKPVPVEALPDFSMGHVSVQDAAAQLAPGLLDLANGMRVLDACAAPGGKTCHLLEHADLDLTALDIDAERLNRVQQNLDRLALSARLIAGSAADDDWWDGQVYDRILADVPCTASGIVRRHPDIRWLRRPEDTAQLATISAQILDNLWKKLRPNGKLLFVTCSIWPQESEQQALNFASRHSALRLPAPGQLLPTALADDDHDGLYYALFQKPE